MVLVAESEELVTVDSDATQNPEAGCFGVFLFLRKQPAVGHRTKTPRRQDASHDRRRFPVDSPEDFRETTGRNSW